MPTNSQKMRTHRVMARMRDSGFAAEYPAMMKMMPGLIEAYDEECRRQLFPHSQPQPS